MYVSYTSAKAGKAKNHLASSIKCDRPKPHREMNPDGDGGMNPLAVSQSTAPHGMNKDVNFLRLPVGSDQRHRYNVFLSGRVPPPSSVKMGSEQHRPSC